MSIIRRAFDRREHRDATLSDLMVQRDRLSSTYAGITVNPLTALQVSAFWACVNLICNTISGLPVHSYRVRGGITVQIEQDPPVVASPSGRLTRSDWLSQAAHSLVVRGNAYGVIVDRDYLGYATQVEMRDTQDVQVTQEGKTGPVHYKVDNVEVPPEDIVHFRGLMPPGGVVGIPALEAMRNTLGVELAAERYGAQWFADGAHPSAILQTDIDKITEESARIVKERFLAAIRGREPVVLGQGLKFQAVQESPANSNLMEIQRFGIEQVARFFGIPPEMIGGASSGSSVTYANREQRAIDFVTFAIKPWLVRIEEPWSALLPRGQYVRFDVDDLMRADTLSRWQANTQKLRSGALSVNEVRQDEHLAPIGPDGDKYLWPPFYIKSAADETMTAPAPAEPLPAE
jgi:HK97 family phage portal protein